MTKNEINIIIVVVQCAGKKRGETNSDNNETVILVYLDNFIKWSSLVHCKELIENVEEKKWPELCNCKSEE